jgi:hypothetical protein
MPGRPSKVICPRIVAGFRSSRGSDGLPSRQAGFTVRAAAAKVSAVA